MSNNIHRHLHHNIERDQVTSLAAAELAPVEKITVTNVVVVATVLDISSPTDGVSQASNPDALDAEASGRIIVSNWNAIAENGVFVVTHISPCEVLGVFKGNTIHHHIQRPSLATDD